MSGQPRITLIQPPRPWADDVPAGDEWLMTRPFSLLFLASAVRSKTSWGVEIVDFELPEVRGASREEVLGGRESAVFGITCATFSRFEAIDIARWLKPRYPQSLIVAGGVHFGYCAEDTLRHVAEIDVVVCGEGELTLVELLRAIAGGESFESVEGLVHRRGDEIVVNPARSDLGEISLPEGDDPGWEGYPEPLYGLGRRSRATSIMASRGCPYRCIYCSAADSQYRLKEPRLVVDEIEELKNRLGIDAFNFRDLTLTAHRSHVRALCEELIERGLGIRWWCESRADIPLELLPLMREAGCVSIGVGVESGSPRMLKILKKKVTPEQVVAFSRRADELGILVRCYFMYSLPEETEEDLEQTWDLMTELEAYAECGLQPCIVFPGTEIEGLARERGVVPPDFSWSEPFDDPLAAELYYCSNAPLFVDRLSPESLRRFKVRVDERQEELRRARRIGRMGYREVMTRGIRYLFVKRGPLRRYLNPRFVSRWARIHRADRG